MPTEDSFALFITWTSYGTWLPGDPRGYVSNTLLHPRGFEQKQNTPGTPYRRDDPYTYQRARANQRHETVFLKQTEAEIAAQGLIDCCSKRNWHILRAALMRNHIHVVINHCPDDGPGVRRILKGNAQADLNRILSCVRKWWTAGGSNRYLRGDTAIEAAIEYVAQQDYKLVEIVNMNIVAPVGEQTRRA